MYVYVWQRLPQGYKNSPNVFQSVMDVLEGLNVTIYIDDVFIADNTEEEHLETLQQVIQWITDAGLKLNLKECQLGRFQVDYLGFQVSTDLGLSDRYKDKLAQITPPSSENDLQKIGLCNYVRDHVPYYQKYAKPLYTHLKKASTAQTVTSGRWTWTATDQNNMEQLKKVSYDGEDAVVTVSNEGQGIVTLWSYTLTTVERKYPPEEKELAVLAR